VKWGLAITVLVDVAVILLREPLVGLFTDNADIIRLSGQVIVVGFLLETGRNFNLVLVHSLRAAGDARFTLYMGFFSMVCMSVPLGYFLVFRMNMGLAGVWFAVAADEWTRGIAMSLRWRSRAWEKQSLVSPMKEQPAVVAAPGA
jgi:Na+-driven multidrug efflux pump